MRSRRIHRRVLIRAVEFTAMPTSQEVEKQRRQDSGPTDRLTAGESLPDRRDDETGDLRVTIHRNARIAVSKIRVRKPLEHDVAIGRQINRARTQYRDRVLGDV